MFLQVSGSLYSIPAGDQVQFGPRRSRQDMAQKDTTEGELSCRSALNMRSSCSASGTLCSRLCFWVQGAARSFTIETVIQSSALMIATGLGCYFALKCQFTYHRQWMIRSYVVALTFIEISVILGVFGLDRALDWHVLQTVAWS